ncbi:MAG: hypothetical protein P8P30_00995 [Rickettsiales bacterium]|nr:hypothetical protein [Rickettsiales bacterium]
MSFTAQLLAKRGHSIERLYYLHAFIDDRLAYYFILIDPPKEPAFLAEIQKGNAMIDLEEFALEIVAKGYGEPSEELQQRIQQKYNAVVKKPE